MVIALEKMFLRRIFFIKACTWSIGCYDCSVSYHRVHPHIFSVKKVGFLEDIRKIRKSGLLIWRFNMNLFKIAFLIMLCLSFPAS